MKITVKEYKKIFERSFVYFWEKQAIIGNNENI
jgi:hypothetical protein